MGRSSRRPRALLSVLITLGVILAAAVILLGVFRIRTLEVNGNSTHSGQAIQEDLIYDFWTGNTLFFAWKYRTAGYEPRTPYLSSVQAKMTSPGTVTLSVSEKRVIGYVMYNSQAVSFDGEGMILDISDHVYDGALLVDGITMDEPMLYQKLSLNNAALLRTMLSITKLTGEAQLSPERISFDENSNITLLFGSVSVELGQDEYLEEKIANLQAIYPKVSSQAGTLNMSAFTGKNETITFSETEAAEPETEPVSEDTDTAAPEDGGEGSDYEGGASAEQTPEDPVVETVDDSPEVDTSNDTSVGVMAFDSSGTLRYDARISGGVVVDSYGNPIDGCSVTEEGYIKDAYWNIINPADGSLMNG